MYVDYYFYVYGLFGCVGGDAQLLYSGINKSWAGCLVVVVASGRSVTTTSLDVGKADQSVSEVILVKCLIDSLKINTEYTNVAIDIFLSMNRTSEYADFLKRSLFQVTYVSTIKLKRKKWTK